MPFQKGVSGNPAGRPVGSGHKQGWRSQIDLSMPDVLGKLIELAKDGDISAANLLMSRSFPAVKSVLPEVDLPLSNDPFQAAQTIMSAVASGVISPDIASSLMESVNKLQVIAQLPDIEDRLKRLEETLNVSG